MFVASLRPGLVAALSLAAAPAAHASAFHLQEQSVKGAGRAFSGETADTGPESLWWNPASIAGMTGGRAYLGASAVLPRGRVVDTGTRIALPGQAPAPVGGDPVARNPIDPGVVPSGAVAWGLSDRVAIGVALTSPYSFTTDYDADSWVRYTADRTKLLTIDVQPAIAVQATPWLRLGVAANIEYADATLGNALPNLVPGAPDGRQRLSGNGWDMGWSAGLQIESGALTVGAAWKSAITHRLKGALTTEGLLGPLAAQNGRIAATARFQTPWQANVGARFAVTPDFTVNAQATRFGWSAFDAIRLGAPINAAIPENYRDSWAYGAGFDWQARPGLVLRAGFQRDRTPTRNGQRDARVPDSDRWNLSAGASWDLSERITLDASASWIDFERARIDRPTAAYAGTPAQTPILVAGELRGARAIVLGFGARARF